MSSIASAAIETDIPYGTRNLPTEDSYIFYDFEDIGGDMVALNIYEGPVQFIDYYRPGYTWKGEPTILHNFWGTAHKNGRAMHVYPWTGWDYINDEPANWVYLIEGYHAGCPIVISEGAVPTPYPGTDGVIQFPDGATHVSFLVSTGGTLTVTAYDRHDNYIMRETVESTITRVNGSDTPSTWSKVTLEASNIYSIHIRGGSNMFLIDDLVIGGLILPEPETNYSWAAERLEQLIGLNYLQYGTAWDYIFSDYRTAEEMLDNKPDPYFNFDYKPPELEFGTGINDQDAILFAFNGNGEDLINWWDINKMAKQDFTEEIPYEEIQSGDVFFIDYPQEFEDGGYGPDGCYDEIGMVIEPTIDTTGDVVDIIRIIPEAGVHYSTTDFINALYGITGVVDYRRLPDNPKGGHSPYPNKPPGKPI